MVSGISHQHFLKSVF
jgi:hypothetical protein